MDTVDPVDWTLAESYLKKSLEEYISSVALLLGPLLVNYDLQNAASITLSKNASFIFTPVEKLPMYPISSQSIQLLLQAQMKSM